MDNVFKSSRISVVLKNTARRLVESHPFRNTHALYGSGYVFFYERKNKKTRRSALSIGRYDAGNSDLEPWRTVLKQAYSQKKNHKSTYIVNVMKGRKRAQGFLSLISIDIRIGTIQEPSQQRQRWPIPVSCFMASAPAWAPAAARSVRV